MLRYRGSMKQNFIYNTIYFLYFNKTESKGCCNVLTKNILNSILHLLIFLLFAQTKAAVEYL